MRDTTTKRVRHASLLLLLICAPDVARAQQAGSDSVVQSTMYWEKFAWGVTTSILAHEAAHIVASYAVGGHPTFGFDKLRPTVYSGIDSHTEPRKQFYFSVAGLTAQSLIDEAILDIPHHRGGAFERGVLGGGIGTTVFYLTIGRRGSVSDVDYVARTHGMSKAQMTALFGSIAVIHTFRIWKDPSYAKFFTAPRVDGGVDLGLSVGPRRARKD